MKADVIIVGGGPAGVITALTAKSVYPEKSVCLIKEIGDSVIPCAIPYMIDTMSNCDQNKMGNQPLEKAGIKILVGKVVSIDAKACTCKLESNKVLSYERLVLATGTNRRPPQMVRTPRANPNKNSTRSNRAPNNPNVILTYPAYKIRLHWVH